MKSSEPRQLQVASTFMGYLNHCHLSTCRDKLKIFILDMTAYSKLLDVWRKYTALWNSVNQWFFAIFCQTLMSFCHTSLNFCQTHWQCAVLSKSVVMFDRTVCVLDRISFRFDRTAQKCKNTNILPKTPSSNQYFEKSPWQNSRNDI